ncbi:MAG: insulinase family protein [Oscillospiraceae bacterium]|nr:insulinase family protein [Oscillospiraceae bacterium]
MEVSRRELLPNVYLTAVETDKFKSGVLSATLLTQLERSSASPNALIPSVLRRGTATLPDMSALQERLDSLYGAGMEPSVRRKGEIQLLSFRSSFCDERFLPGREELCAPLASLLGEMWLRPETRGGLLRPDYVESERDKLVERIDGRVNDKISYALSRLLEEMCCFEDFGVSPLGTRDSAESIYYVNLTRRYRDLLATSPVELFYCGAMDADKVASHLTEAFLPLPRGEIDPELGTDIRMNTVEAEPRFFEEAMDVAQGQLALGFRLGKCMEEPDYAVLRVLNALYGGSVTSKLFMNVREKLSLCYYASSMLDAHKGVMAAIAGIRFDDRQKAQDEMLRQLDELRQGRFTDEELHSAKAHIASSLRSVGDTPGGLEDFYLDQTLLGLDYGPDELAALVEDVSAGEVAKAAGDIALDAAYFLRGEEKA